jgi:uncharacterized iron-regulated membrane protein
MTHSAPLKPSPAAGGFSGTENGMNVRKCFFWAHLCAGVAAGLVILVMSVTGVLLTYQRQIISWAERGLRTPPPPVADQRLSPSALLERARAAHPGTNPASITIRADPSAPVQISFGRELTFVANPYTGESLGPGAVKVRAFFHAVTDWHRWLGMQGERRAVGKAITGASNLVFLFLIASGFYLWWPRKWTWSALKPALWFGRGLRGRARDWNWHNVIGFWSAIPLFIVAFTGMFFSYPWANDLLYRITRSEPPPRPASTPRTDAPRKAESSVTGEVAKSRDETPRPPAFDNLDALWAVAADRLPHWQSITLRLPAGAASPFVFTIDQGTGARPDLRHQLTLDGKTGEVKADEPYQSYNLGRRIRLWIRWVHTGEAGGVLGQTLAGAVSAGGAVLVWTGLALAWRRFSGRRGRSLPENAAASESA